MTVQDSFIATKFLTCNLDIQELVVLVIACSYWVGGILLSCLSHSKIVMKCGQFQLAWQSLQHPELYKAIKKQRTESFIIMIQVYFLVLYELQLSDPQPTGRYVVTSQPDQQSQWYHQVSHLPNKELGHLWYWGKRTIFVSFYQWASCQELSSRKEHQSPIRSIHKEKKRQTRWKDDLILSSTVIIPNNVTFDLASNE